MTGETPVWDPYFIETLEGSFSAVSTPQIARVGAFFSIFRDLQDVNSFAPLHTQKFNKISSRLHFRDSLAILGAIGDYSLRISTSHFRLYLFTFRDLPFFFEIYFLLFDEIYFSYVLQRLETAVLSDAGSTIGTSTGVTSPSAVWTSSFSFVLFIS